MHEENFWSSWLRVDERGKEQSMSKAEKNEEGKGDKRKKKRGERRERNGESQKKNVRLCFCGGL